MRKIAADRNYRLVKEALKVDGVDVVTFEIIKRISEEFEKQRGNILKNNTNIKKLWEKIYPGVAMP